MPQKVGYAAGSTDGGEWLTVWGSAYRSDLVYATRDEAEQRAAELRANTVATQRDRVIVRKVQPLGGIYFKIIGD
jgi:hypothetical protein